MIELLQNLWRPVVEILVLGVGLYYALVFIRGTRGAAIVTGFLVVLLALVLMIRVLDLQVLSVLLGSLSGVFTLACIVLFQPELRRLLAGVGTWRLFNPLHAQREGIEIIIETAERLADVRIGALVAIEQSSDLTEAVESGVPVDCVATSEMLETIFFPNNAVHDGGVIIKGGRIVRAACIFPLSRRQDLSKSLGTRHRAALGLAEETDAVVIVVSEETGRISYAFKSQLVRGVTIEELRAFLSSVLVPPTRARSWLDWWRQRRSSVVKVEELKVVPQPVAPEHQVPSP